jgi:hypothetical protein
MKLSFNRPYRQTINPAEHAELWYWSEKWGISIKELENAIIDTGKTDVKTLRRFLMQKNQFYFLVRNFIGTLKTPFMKFTPSTA